MKSKLYYLWFLVFILCSFIACDNAALPTTPELPSEDESFNAELPTEVPKDDETTTESGSATFTRNFSLIEGSSTPSNLDVSAQDIYTYITDTTGEGNIEISFNLDVIVPEGNFSSSKIVRARIGEYLSIQGDGNYYDAYFNDDTELSVVEFNDDKTSAKLTIKLSSTILSQRGSIPIVFEYNKDVYASSNTSSLLITLYSKGSHQAKTIGLDSITVDTVPVSISKPDEWALEVMHSSSFNNIAETTIPFSLKFVGLESGYPITFKEKEGSNVSIVNVTVSDISNGECVISFNATYNSSPTGSLVLTVTGDSNVYKGLPYDIVVNTRRNYDGLFLDAITEKTLMYRSSVRGNSELLETFVSSNNGHKLTHTVKNTLTNEVISVNDYVFEKTLGSGTTAQYSGITIDISESAQTLTTSNFEGKIFKENFTDPGVWFTDKIKGRTYSYRIDTEGVSETLHRYVVSSDGMQIAYSTQDWRETTFTPKDTYTISTVDYDYADSDLGKITSPGLTQLNAAETLLGIENFNDPGPFFLDKVKGQTFTGDETYVFDDTGKSFTMKGRNYDYVGVNKGNKYTAVEYGYPEDWGLFDVWWFCIVRLENNDKNISTGSKGGTGLVVNDELKYNKATLVE